MYQHKTIFAVNNELNNMSCKKNLKIMVKIETKNGKSYLGFPVKWEVERIINDQANKSVWWMPWHQAPKKDVTSCEKLRGVANRPRSVDIRMRELTISNVMVSLHEYIV